MSLLEADFPPRLEEEMSSGLIIIAAYAHCQHLNYNNCQKRSILEKLVDEEQRIFQSDQCSADQTCIPQQAGGRTESRDRV